MKNYQRVLLGLLTLSLLILTPFLYKSTIPDSDLYQQPDHVPKSKSSPSSTSLPKATTTHVPPKTTKTSATTVYQSDGKSENSSKKILNLLYYNRHSGCRDNFLFVTKHFNISFDMLDPAPLSGLGTMDKSRSNELLSTNMGTILCKSYDLIIVADTVPDARHILQALDNGACNAHVVLELTTRFDLFIPDKKEFYALIKSILSKKVNKQLHWIANNPFEIKHVHQKVSQDIEFKLLRALGYSSVIPSNDQISNVDRSKVLIRADQDKVRELLKPIQSYEYLGSHYGGPRILANSLAFIEFPYQVSTMKLYENIAHGVVVYLPSYTLFKELVETGVHEYSWMNDLKEFGNNWYEYVDYYHTDLKDYLYYFDSIPSLISLVNNATEAVNEMIKEGRDVKNPLDTKNIRETGPIFYKKHMRKKILEGWKDQFEIAGYNFGGLDLVTEMSRIENELKI